MDNRMHQWMLKIRSIVTKKDFDWAFLICGREGYGKSTLAQQMAYVCAGGILDQKDVCLTLNEFVERIKYHGGKGNIGRSVIFDETMGTANARAFNSVVNQKLNKILAECRQFNLHLFILLPSYFDLDKPIALHRAKTLIKVEVDPKTYDRGRYYAYNERSKLKLYLKGKKTYEYKVKPTSHGKYSKFYCVNEAEYRKRKAKAFNDYDDSSIGARDKNYLRMLYNVFAHLKTKENYNGVQLAALADTDKMMVSRVLNDYKPISLGN